MEHLEHRNAAEVFQRCSHLNPCALGVCEGENTRNTRNTYFEGFPTTFGNHPAFFSPRRAASIRVETRSAATTRALSAT